MPNYVLLNPQPKHFEQIQELCKRVYPFSKPWSLEQLESHRSYFPDGQLIVIDEESGLVVGMAFSLIISWDEYSHHDNWQDFTSGGFFHNHNPRKGKTLYGAEVMVDPEMRGRGIGKMLYSGRQQIVERYNLRRIRAGARLRGFSKFKDKMDPEDYVQRVIEKKIYDPTLSFQLNQGFQVIDVAANYLFNDPESLGFAAVIEWLNPKAALPRDYEKQKQNIDQFLSGENFVPHSLPKELRRLVRKATQSLGAVIQEYEGENFYRRVESYRVKLKKTRKQNSKAYLKILLDELSREPVADRLKLAHAFALQLEAVNACEAAYRTWRLRQKAFTQGGKSKLNLTYVLTAHPTEARSKVTVDSLDRLELLLIDGIHNNFLFNDDALLSQMRMLWLYPLSKIVRPSVVDEARYIYSLIFSPDLFDFILTDKPSYDLKLRTWVGGDKDGHPGVNQVVMKQCLTESRAYILHALSQKFASILSDLSRLEVYGRARKSEIDQLKAFMEGLKRLQVITTGDGTKVKTWSLKFRSFLKAASPFVRRHHQALLLLRALELFPALVLPIELREDSSLIEQALKDKNSPIRGMLTELNRISGALDLTFYASGFVISHCEDCEDITQACQLVELASRSRTLPVIPLFESREALLNAKKILKEWLSILKNQDRVHRHWKGKYEVMLGYSDSAKQVGVLPSRYLISRATFEIERVLKGFQVKPIFFHGSGGSVARGGGSLKEQIAWWSQAAVENPKITIQGEMIQRLFSTKEILNSQCVHMANEALKRRVRKLKYEKSAELELLAKGVEVEYSKLVKDMPKLAQLLEASPYRYLEVLKIGSRPSKRPSENVTTSSLRAIPWVLCWTQTRLLFPTWWGLGTTWAQLSPEQQQALQKLFTSSPFFFIFCEGCRFHVGQSGVEYLGALFQRRGCGVI